MQGDPEEGTGTVSHPSEDAPGTVEGNKVTFEPRESTPRDWESVGPDKAGNEKEAGEKEAGEKEGGGKED